MRYAISAKTHGVLGATLIAIATPVHAGIDGGAINGIDGGATAGIDGGAVHGIDGGAIAGIDGGAILGIDGGATAGIDGGATAGIDGGAILGIDGGAAAGIDGGAILGIDGGAAAGIDGGAILGIDGGAAAGIDGGANLGIDGGAAAGIDGGAILAGPVEAIDIANGVFESLGQTVLASNEMLRDMRVGDFVTVEGTVMGPGWLFADEVTVTDISYVPGATEVYVSGMLTSIDNGAGKARMGGLTVDYTPSLASTEAPSGAMWSFRGTRPVSDGLMISELSSKFTQ